jgi:hypothetical protein
VRTNVVWINVAENLKSGNQPVYMHERPLVHGSKPKGGLFNTSEVARTGEYWVPLTPLVDMDEIQWSKTASERYVRIPVSAYLTESTGLASILATGLEIGARAMTSLAMRYKQEPKEIILVIGHECMDLSAEGRPQFRCFVGLAAKTK